MKKLIILFICVLFIIPVVVFIVLDNSKDVKKAIETTKNYLNKNELEDNMFANVLQDNLNKSLIYTIDNNKTLIIYNGKNYIYENNSLKKAKNLDFKIVNTISDAFNEEIGSKILTRGYKNKNDGGNAYFTLENYISDEGNELILANENHTKSLKFCNFDSVINIYQIGYEKNDYLDEYINLFTSSYKYEYVYVPKGKYIVQNNFDVNVSNKAYYGYEANIVSNDTYDPSGYNSGCLFYVSNNIKNIRINGFNVNVEVKNKLDDPLLGLLSARDVDGLVLNNCSFYLPKEASIYSSSGMVDLFTGWSNVIIKNCKLENHSSTVAGGGIGIRDIYKKGCINATIENNYIYSNCKDEVIAVFSGGDTSLYPNETGGGYIKNVVFKNNTIVGGKPNEDLGPRVVGLTVGYQLSPVYNISFIDNTIEMYSANYLLLYGKASTVLFKNNDVKIDSSYQEDLYIMFSHNSHADAGEDITVDNNNFEFINNSGIYTIASTNEEFKFINNNINCFKIYRVFDSKSLFENNVIEANTISKAIYHNVKETKNNTITCDKLTIVYEFYNLNITDDIVISDNISTNSISSNFMMFNGNSISFNNHTVTFKNFIFNTNEVESKYYYLAYDTSIISDNCVINFINSKLSIYDDEKHNYVVKDDNNKVNINFINN